MTIKMVRNLYHEILKKILALEVEKKEIAVKILILKTGAERLPLIRDFLERDISKYQLLEQAAVAAMQNQANEVLDHIGKLCPPTDDISVIQGIRAEISRNQGMLTLVGKEIKHSKKCTFTERRILREIHKYVVSQAREYARTSF